MVRYDPSEVSFTVGKSFIVARLMRIFTNNPYLRRPPTLAISLFLRTTSGATAFGVNWNGKTRFNKVREAYDELSEKLAGEGILLPRCWRWKATRSLRGKEHH